MQTTRHDHLLTAYTWEGNNYVIKGWEYLSFEYCHALPGNIHVKVKFRGPKKIHGGAVDIPTTTDITSESLDLWLATLAGYIQANPKLFIMDSMHFLTVPLEHLMAP